MNNPVAQLVQRAYQQNQESMRQFLKRADINYKTMRSFMDGEVQRPAKTTQTKIEQALGWQEDIIEQLLRDQRHIDFDALTPDSLREGEPLPLLKQQTAPVREKQEKQPAPAPGQGNKVRAADLTDEELTSELAYRLRRYREAI